ncbi:MAG: NUDIX domain-containing protein [Bacteroidia bacterium]
MYKVFTNSACIFFSSKNNFSNDDLKEGVVMTANSQKELKKNISQFLSSVGTKNVFVIFKNKNEMENFISSFFKIIEAAGGLVKNDVGDLLLIFRNEKWDLPKGKVEKDEKIKQAALREVQEECGIESLKIIKKATTTYHLYTLKNKFILKKTFWFEMESNERKTLKPQLEEGITKVKWMNKSGIKKAMKNTYPLIKELLKDY